MRRLFLIVVGAATALPFMALAQQAPVPRIVRLAIPSPPELIDALYQGLADHGYIVGKNIQVEIVTAPTTKDFPALAAKVVGSKPDIIVTVGTPGAQALKDATSTIPIVAITDLAGSGLVASLSHPGGNITGVSTVAPDLVDKQMDLLHESDPTVKRIAILNIPNNPVIARDSIRAKSTAMALGIQPLVFDFDEGKDLSVQFGPILAAGVEAVVVPNATYFKGSESALCDLLLKNRLASIFAASVGSYCGLVTYGPNNVAQHRQLASFVVGILRGTKPGDLPVEQPTVFDFVANLKTAKALGITIPPSVVVQATQVIE